MELSLRPSKRSWSGGLGGPVASAEARNVWHILFKHIRANTTGISCCFPTWNFWVISYEPLTNWDAHLSRLFFAWKMWCWDVLRLYLFPHIRLGQYRLVTPTGLRHLAIGEQECLSKVMCLRSSRMNKPWLFSQSLISRVVLMFQVNQFPTGTAPQAVDERNKARSLVIISPSRCFRCPRWDQCAGSFWLRVTHSCALCLWSNHNRQFRNIP